MWNDQHYWFIEIWTQNYARKVSFSELNINIVKPLDYSAIESHA